MRLPVIMVIIYYLLFILTDFLILSDLGLRIGRLKETWRRKGVVTFGVFALLVIAVLTVAVCLPKKDASEDISAIMWLLYITLTVSVAQIIYCIFSFVGYIPKIFGLTKWPTGLWIGLPLAVITFIMMWYGSFVGRYKIETTYTEINSPRLPESFDGYKIAQISDIHVGTWGNDTTFISQLVDSVMAQKPDMIVFTGDAVNRMSDEFRPFIKPLSRLSAPDGVYSVLGNHDYGDYIKWKTPEKKRADLEALKQYEKDAGWVLLDNASTTIRNHQGDSILLIGVGNWGEPPFSQYGDLQKAYPAQRLRDDNFKILLSHNPRHWDEIVSRQSNIDITLSGHTHAMQMMFELGPWRWSPAQMKYSQWGGVYGRHNEMGDTTNLYVNIGAGEVGLPMRVGATPEISLITLRRR